MKRLWNYILYHTYNFYYWITGKPSRRASYVWEQGEIEIYHAIDEKTARQRVDSYINQQWGGMLSETEATRQGKINILYRGCATCLKNLT